MIEKIENSKNVVTASIDAGGNVTVGDTIVINLKEAAKYKALLATLARLDEKFEKIKAKIEKYPEDEYFKVELLDLSKERNDKQQELDTLTQDVLELAEEFCNRPINTQRLEQARKHFQAGEFDKARAVLDAEKMGNELDDAIRRRELGKQMQSQAKEELSKLVNEYLILARLTAINFELPDWFEKTKAHFEQSLKAERNGENLFAYARFLQEHNQFVEGQPLYEEVLEQYRTLAQANPQTYLPKVALTLNNLGILLKNKNEYEKAEVAYQEALKIRRRLARKDHKTYLPEVAMTLNNIGILLRNKNEHEKAEKAYRKALRIKRKLAQDNPETYLPEVALTLNNLGVLLKNKNEYRKAKNAYQKALQIRRMLAEDNSNTCSPEVATTLNNIGILLSDKNKHDKAEEAYQEALYIKRELAQNNPQTYLPKVATTLTNIGILLRNKNEHEKAQNAYQEALKIRRRLAQNDPNTYLPKVAMTTAEMSVFYNESIPDKAQSLAYAEEALKAALPFAETVPALEKYTRTALQVVQTWGEDPQAFLQKILDQLDNPQP